VAWGRCWEGGGAPPFWPWREALDGCGAPFPDAGLLATGDLAEARFALFRDVAGALGREAARQPLLFVVVATYRDLEARSRPDVADVLARLGRAGKELRLRPLSEADVEKLVSDAMLGLEPDLPLLHF
jgi:hypothetical protein